MLGGLARKDQRAAGELYVRGLLTGGQRKSVQPMAARLGVDHQRLQQFITSSTWDYVAVRRNVARWFAGSQVVEALVVDDTGFAAGAPAADPQAGRVGEAAAAGDSHGTRKLPGRAGIVRFRNLLSRSRIRFIRCPGSGCGCCSSGSWPAGWRSAARAGRWAR
jgi:hypothetical protein